MSTDEFTVDSVPHAPPTVVGKKDAGLYLLLDPDTPNWVIVDDIGKDIIELCDGETSMKEIIEVLCKKYEEPYKESVEGVLTFANQLREQQFLQKQEFPPCSGPDKKNAPLERLWISVTNQCNLQCIHCHLSSGVPLENELTTEEICQVISDAAELGVTELMVTGGEPLLQKDIIKILEYGSQHIEKVLLITNGMLVTEEMAEALCNINMRIQVSLDGACQETHDFIRGEGSFEKVISGLQKLVKAGAQPVISMTVMKKNLNEISEMADLARKLRIGCLHFPFLQIIGRAKENEAQVALALENEDLVKATKEILDIPEVKNMGISMERNVRAKIEKLHKLDFCKAGYSIVSVSADGNVYPCNGLHEDEFCAGNIREQQLKDIWEESEIFNKFKSFSVLDIPECRTCDIKFICGGGCHVDRYSAYGKLDMPTPFCEAQKRIYWDLLSEKMKEVQMNL